MVAGAGRTSFARVIFLLAATFVVLIGIRLAAPVLNPILFAIVFGLLFAPVHAWLQRRLPSSVALVIMLVVLLVLFLGLFVLLSASITRLTGRLGFYATQLNGQLGDLQESPSESRLSGLDIGGAVDAGVLVGALGTVLSGIAGFLSSLFLVLMIMLFLLSEGSALMGRLRSAVASDNPQVARLTVIG